LFILTPPSFSVAWSMKFRARAVPMPSDRDYWRSGELWVLQGNVDTARRRSDSTMLVASVRGRLLLLVRSRILNAIKHLADSLVGHRLEDSDFGLLPGGQQRIGVREELLLVRQAIRIRLIEFLDHLFDFLIGTAAIGELANLIQRSGTPCADFKSV